MTCSSIKKLSKYFIFILVAVAFSCSRSTGDNLPEWFLLDGVNPPRYTLGGTVQNFNGTNFTLKNTVNQDLLTITNSGITTQPFQFKQTLRTLDSYNVVIVDYPVSPSQFCQLSQASGIMGDANVKNIVAQCVDAYRISGNISGGAGVVGSGLSVSNDGGEVLPIDPASTTFTFHTPLSVVTYGPSGSNVTITAQPTSPWQTCYFGAPGTYTTTTGTNIATDTTLATPLTCTTNSYNVSATISGLTYNGLGVTVNGTPGTYNAGATVTGSVAVASGQPYGIFITAQPPGQNCSIFGGGDNSTTIVQGSNVVATISCSVNSYSAGGSATNLVGSGLVVQISGTRYGGAPYTLSKTIPPGASYVVTAGLNYGDTITSADIITHPTGPNQWCTFPGAVTTYNPGVTVTGGVTLSAITCTTNTIGGSISGYSAPSTGLTITYAGAGSGTTVLNPVAGTTSWNVSPTTIGETYTLTVTNAYNPGLLCTPSVVNSTIGGTSTVQNITCTAMPAANMPAVVMAGLDNTVTMTPGTAGDTICYRIDGTAPGCALSSGGAHNSAGGFCASGSTAYTAPFTIASTTTFKAVDCAASATTDESAPTTYTGTVAGTVGTPGFAPAGATFNNDTTVTITSAGSTAIYYTTDGSTPDCAPTGTLYGGPVAVDGTITVSGSVTLKAIGCAAGVNPSAVNQTTYTLLVDTPVISMPASTGQITLSNVTTGDTIYYTTDGSTPTCAAAGTEITYAGTFTYPFVGTNPSTGSTVKILGCKTGYVDSTAVTQVAVATPTVTLDNLINNGPVRTGFLVGTAAAPDSLIDMDSVYVSLDGGAYTVATIAGAGANLTWKFQLPNGASTWKEGTSHTIRVYSRNRAGMTSSITAVTVTKRNNADVDGDGYPEIATSGDAYHLLSSYPNVYLIKGQKGAMGTSVQVIATTILNATFGYAVGLGDVNGDGYGDLIVSEPETGSGMIYGYLGSAGGITAVNESGYSFRIVEDITNFLGNYLLVADTDFDGIDDIITTMRSGSNMALVFSKPGTLSGSYNRSNATVAALTTTMTVSNIPNALAYADFNGDGYRDLAVGLFQNPTTGRVEFFKGTAGGINPTVEASSISGPAVGKMAAGDLDQDGKSDLVLYNQPNRLGYTYQSGANFVFTLEYNGSQDMVHLRLGDVDGDGDLDVATLDNVSNSFKVYKNKYNGILNFNQLFDLTTPDLSYSLPGYTGFCTGIIIDDLNMDGTTDLLTVSETDDSLYFFADSVLAAPVTIGSGNVCIGGGLTGGFAY